ncbi:PREDICTED: pentatricopeptide repeat-containing protein At1g63400-like isoform X2 [Nelumbo nucifera]|uniref:Pentatricopeptide repeat-containing protein At1g63400-like isoform X2 n=1 Tax=Nelumbo nucifera TaxID=4432 RepID=A0A1U8A9G9_NELNU|nr:PREDICTED: pentatricopeptide repeat-containing protein At1g63400-like isoform X2 [Nelumbo nucifera]
MTGRRVRLTQKKKLGEPFCACSSSLLCNHSKSALIKRKQAQLFWNQGIIIQSNVILSEINHGRSWSLNIRSLVNVAVAEIHPTWAEEENAQDQPFFLSKGVRQFLDSVDRVRIGVSSASSVGTNDDESVETCKSHAPLNRREKDFGTRVIEVVWKTSKVGHARNAILAKPKIGARPVPSHPAEYNRLMKVFSRAGNVDEVLRLLRDMKEAQCHSNVLCYNTVLNCLAVANRFDDIDAVLAEMDYGGIVPNVSTFNILVKAYSCHSFQFKVAFEVLKKMSEHGCSPDVITYSTLITGLSRAGRHQDAYAVLDRMLANNVLPNVYTYTPLLQGLCKKGEIQNAKDLIETMWNNGCPPNTETYNILIDALCKFGNFGEVESIFEENKSKGWKPNAVSYNIYLNGLCKVGRVEEAFRKLESMVHDGLYLTTQTLNIILDCLCYNLKVCEAKNLLDLCHDLGWDVSSVNYNTVMTGFYKVGQWLSIFPLLTNMLNKGVSPNTRTYNIVIRSLCKVGKLRRAKHMVESKSHGLYSARNIVEAEYLLSRMTTKDKIDTAMSANSIWIGMLCRKGQYEMTRYHFDKCLKKGFQPDVVSYSILIDGYMKNGQIGEGLQLLDRMLDQGVVPNIAVYDSIIRAFCSRGFCHSSKILHILTTIDKMLQKS